MNATTTIRAKIYEHESIYAYTYYIRFRREFESGARAFKSHALFYTAFCNGQPRQRIATHNGHYYVKAGKFIFIHLARALLLYYYRARTHTLAYYYYYSAHTYTHVTLLLRSHMWTHTRMIITCINRVHRIIYYLYIHIYYNIYYTKSIGSEQCWPLFVLQRDLIIPQRFLFASTAGAPPILCLVQLLFSPG